MRYLLPGRGLRARVFYLDKGDKKILIDSGWGVEQKEGKGKLLELLNNMNVQPDSITDILLTHMDFDHLGGLVKEQIAVFPNASIWISRPEYEAWRAGRINSRPAGKLEFANETIDKYGNSLHLFDFGNEILPGITAIDTNGQTPGHTAYEIDDGKNKVVAIGDIIISEAQMLRPQLYSINDMDHEQATKSRERILKYIDENYATLIGMRMDRFGKITKNENGGYVFID